jgi:CO/xanthine dehydrogenase Mo-binding subunit
VPEPHNFCAYGVELSVDRDTGAVAIHDVVFAADVGAVINPVAHRGQIDGGFAFGLGHALTEELRFEDGRVINPSLADYKLPTHCDMPPLRVELLHGARGPGPFGAKMAGELSTAAVPAAIANAVADACGVRITELPLTAERVYASLERSGA